MEGALVEADYGEGAFGATIMVTLRSEAGISYLTGLLKGLGEAAPGTTVELQERPEVSMQAAVFHLTLRVVDRSSHRHLVRTHRGGFDWSCTSDEWATVALLVEALREGPGHQYLTSEVHDDAIVEVSYGEGES